MKREASCAESKDSLAVLHDHSSPDKDIIDNPLAVSVSDPLVISNMQSNNVRLFSRLYASYHFLEAEGASSIDGYSPNYFGSSQPQLTGRESRNRQLAQGPVRRTEVCT